MAMKKKVPAKKKPLPKKKLIGKAKLLIGENDAEGATNVGPVFEMVLTTDTVLDQRGTQYGKFSHHAIITQLLKSIIRGEDINLDEYAEVQAALKAKFASMPANMREAMDMTMHKYGRILNGNHNYQDSWTDVCGYNRLVDKKLGGEDI